MCGSRGSRVSCAAASDNNEIIALHRAKKVAQIAFLQNREELCQEQASYPNSQAHQKSLESWRGTACSSQVTLPRDRNDKVWKLLARLVDCLDKDDSLVRTD